MTSISEAAGQQSQLQSALRAGLDNIDRNQTVSFTQYNKFTMPVDGTVYWVGMGSAQTVSGSVHYAINRQQNEDETLGVNTVTFTSEEQISFLNSVSPTTLWIGTFEGLQFAFSNQADFYQQADLWHYVGNALYPALASQLVGSTAGLLALQPIVSNSLPIWLAQNSFAPVYSSFLVPDNVTPPYIVAHVIPEETMALQAFPTFSWPGTIEPNTGSAPLHALASDQLMRDRVRHTLYAFNNQTAIQYLVALEQYSLNTDDFGFMNSPAIRDDKRTQVELAILAQKKTIEIVASYYQSTANAIAQRLILEASASLVIA